jgi:hypothetical protein
MIYRKGFGDMPFIFQQALASGHQQRPREDGPDDGAE